jgi:IPT/TIG domain/Repeat of unknown function (DUF346)
MASQFLQSDVTAESLEDVSAIVWRRRRRWRSSTLGLLAALLAVAVVAPLSVSASAPVHVNVVSPNAGPTTGGTVTVTILGSGFQSGAQVKFCDQSVSVSSLTAIKITAVAPAFSSFAACLLEVDNPDGGRSPELVAFNYYEQLPAVAATSAAGAATHDVPGGGGDTQVDVFVSGSDSNLHHTFHTDFSPAWSGWENLGGTLTSAPTAVSWGSQNRIDVFVRGSDNALWHKWWTGTSWSGWESLGGVLAAAPVVTSWATGRLDVFARGTDNQLWHRFYAGGWSGWEPLGGVLNSAPGGVSWGPNRIDVFVQGTDQAVWHKWWGGASWGGWESLHGSITQAPAATSRGFGDLEVYALDSTTGQNLAHFSYSGGWLGPRPEGPYWNGTWGFSPGVASQSFVIGPETFMVGGDNTVWHGLTFGPQVGSRSSRTKSTPASRH